MKHLDEPYPPRQGFQNQGYQAPAPMMGGGLGGKPEPPQYAQFEVGKSGLAVEPKTLSEDALPPMPSWDSAAKKHVVTEEENNAVELGELDPTTGQKVPLMTSAASPAIGGPPSPAHDPSPYGARPGQGVGGNGYIGVGGDAYGQPNSSNSGYRGSPSPGPGRGMGGPGRGYGPTSVSPDGQGRGYPPSPQDQYANDGFGGAGAGYGRSQPQRQNSNDTYGSRQYPPQPQRQYSDDSARPLNPGRQYSDRPYPSDNFQPSGPPPRGPSRGPGGPGRMASPPLNNNSGFDFGSGAQPYPRNSPPPQQMPYGSSQGARSSPPLQQGGYYGGSTAPPSYASRSPPPQEPSYPGYKPYQAPNQESRAPQALLPGGGRREREPQNWDPVQR